MATCGPFKALPSVGVVSYPICEDSRRRVEMMTHIPQVGPSSLTEAGPGEAHASPKTSRKTMVD